MKKKTPESLQNLDHCHYHSVALGLVGWQSAGCLGVGPRPQRQAAGQLFEKSPQSTHPPLQPLEDRAQVLPVDSQVPVTLTHLRNPQEH